MKERIPPGDDIGRVWLRTLLAAEVTRTGQSAQVVKEAGTRLRELLDGRVTPKARLSVLLAATLAELDEGKPCPPHEADGAGETVERQDAHACSVRFTCRHCRRSVIERREPNPPKA